MRNSIAIAERLVRSQNENKRLSKAVEEGKQEIASLQAELSGVRATMNAASGPDAYVVERLQTQEKRIADLTSHSNALEDHLRGTQSELQRVVRENGELKDELKKVLHNRAQLESIGRPLICSEGNKVSPLLASPQRRRVVATIGV